ncbi:zinc ABC transporter substrate-binding protein [Acinetobacter qingfengensis]|uniref:High-affinity zinc uptake system protein ZnuA n=1 Tax=Acinetobacter qingfengensis TaxID=1262585 RepID=A0A1E7RDA7_9GAMM|nr:zinc ABC transporter substrate-binding protein [Acinetobacter qingfengensis]KAA8732128.1 zinc ABC transporter substrate-binding protein [Acinetobacter qingfengensis]OEY97207.1 DNA repair protein [Acinetobacter qingfengensis]
MRFLVVMVIIASFSQFALAKGLVVSTHPLYLIAQEVTKGVEQPALLLTPQQSGHDIQLTPKGRQMVQDADLVIWLGKQHEAPLQSLLSQKSNAIALLNSSILKTLPQRDVKGRAIANSIDTHVWLEPNNAIRIGFFIAALRSQQQPQYKAQYWQNAQNFAKEMLAVSRVVNKNSRPKNYWAYHDAYQYVERALNLQFAGALTTDPEIPPTIAQIQYLMVNKPQKNMCILAEYHADGHLIQRLAPVTTVTVDEAMANENNFVIGWKKLIKSIQQCLH